MTEELIPELPIPDLSEAPLPEIHHEHHHDEHHHDEHHEIAVNAFELWEQTVTSNGVDYGPEYYWYLARFKMGIGPDPLPPPVE
jgi:hypothetical protein